MFKKKSIKLLTVSLLSLTFTYAIISNLTETSDAIRQGILMCVQTVIPSLFPFFVLSGIIVDTGLAAYIGKPFQKLMMPLFRIKGAGASALVLGLIGGYPIGAACATSLYEKNLCTKNETERLLAFCNNSGPGFIIGVVGTGIFRNARIGILLYAVHIIAALITGLIFRFFKPIEGGTANHSSTPSVISSLPSAFAKSIKSAITSCINISAFIIFFAVIVRLLDIYNIITPLSNLFPFQGLAKQILFGLLEVTNGLIFLPECSGSINSHIIAASFLLGWAGISIHFQTLSIIESRLSIKPYITGKLLQAFISSLITAIILKSSIVVTTFAPEGVMRKSIDFLTPGIITTSAGILMLTGVFLLIFYQVLQNDWKNIHK